MLIHSDGHLLHEKYLFIKKMFATMNSMIKFFAALALVAVVAVTACKDDDPAGCNWTQDLQAELDAYTAAANAWAADPQNTAKCNAYRDALQDYIDEAQTLQSCANAAGQGNEFQQALQQAEDSLAGFTC
jgi:hypothetical protein